VKRYFANLTSARPVRTVCTLTYWAFVVYYSGLRYFPSAERRIDQTRQRNNNSTEQTTDNMIDEDPWSFPKYTPEKIQDETLPFLVYAQGSAGDAPLFIELFSDVKPVFNASSSDMDMPSYIYGAPIVRYDGRMEGAQQPPEYYAYSPDRSNTWEEGLQAIDDFDWVLTDEQHGPYETTHASAMDISTGRYSDPAVSSRNQSEHRDAELSQVSPPPHLPVHEGHTIQTLPDKVTSSLWIPSSVRIQNSEAPSVSEVVSAESSLEVEVKAEPGRLGATTTGTEAETEPAETRALSPIHKSLLNDTTDIQDSQDHSTHHHVVSSISMLKDDAVGQVHSAKSLSDASSSISVHAETQEPTYPPPAQLPHSLMPLNAENSALLFPTSRIASEETQSGADMQGDQQLQDGIDAIPYRYRALSPLTGIESREPGEDASSLELQNNAQDAEGEAPEQSLAAETTSEFMSTLSRELEEMEIEDLESSGVNEEQSRDLPPFADMMQTLSLPVTTGASTAVDEQNYSETPAPTTAAHDLRKRTRSTRTDTSPDSEREAPAKKKSKAGSLVQSAVKSETASSKVDETKAELPVEVLERPTPTKSPKEAGGDVAQESLKTTQECNNVRSPKSSF
jgi:hypothetical protein